MIRWYDYVVALMVADVMATTFFSLGFVGPIIAYYLYEWGWTAYCEWRKGMKHE